MHTIHTLEARGNVLLESMRDYFKMSPQSVRKNIIEAHSEVQKILTSKSINYPDLRTALVPSSDRHEAGFIFDTQQIESGWYGYEVANVLLPLLDKRMNHSVRCGDLLGENQDQRTIFEILQESLILARSFNFVHSSVLYCVYLNNISEPALKSIHLGLQKNLAYVGYIPATFMSRAKMYLSITLAGAFLKCGNKIIMGHEDDRANEENVNMLGYPFEENGYKIASLQEMYFDLFLTYKIERPVFPGYASDIKMSLNAISDQVVPLEDCTVLLEDAKHEYLLSEKIGSLEKAGIEKLSGDELASLIKRNIAANYIYNLVLNEHNVTKFNLMLEIPRGDGYPAKLTVALEYKPSKKILRVITMF